MVWMAEVKRKSLAVAAIAYDRWGFPELERAIADAGVKLPPLVEHGQGWKDQAPSVAALEREVIEHRLQSRQSGADLERPQRPRRGRPDWRQEDHQATGCQEEG